MAKKLNSADYLLFGTIAVGGLGYYLYSKGKLPFVDKVISKIKGEDVETPSTPPIANSQTTGTPVVQKTVNAKTPVDPFKEPAYIDKVKRLQVYLGVGVDGNAGSSDTSQTNQALKKKFDKLYIVEGRLRPTNVDKYIKALNDKSAQEISVQKSQDASKQRKAFGEKLKNLYSKDKSRIVRSSDIKIQTRFFDKARNSYTVDGNQLTIYKNDPLFPKFSYVAYDSNGYWILKTPSGKFVITNPNEYVAK